MEHIWEPRCLSSVFPRHEDNIFYCTSSGTAQSEERRCGVRTSARKPSALRTWYLETEKLGEHGMYLARCAYVTVVFA